MGFSLKNLLHKAVAQITPSFIDHGQTAATVAQRRQPPPPARPPTSNNAPPVRPNAPPQQQQQRPLSVTVAPPRTLQMGNMQFKPDPNAHTSSPADLIKLAQVQQQIKQGPPPAPVSLHNMLAAARDFVAKPAAEIGATITGNTFHPGNPIERTIFGHEPIKPIQQDVQGVYQAVQSGHQNLPGGIPISSKLAAPYAAADAVLHAAQDIPLVGGVIKGAVKATIPAATKVLPTRLVPVVPKIAGSNNITKGVVANDLPKTESASIPPQTLQMPATPKTTLVEAPQMSIGRPPQVSVSPSLHNTPVAENTQFSPEQYIKEQTKLQKQAAEGGTGPLIQAKQDFRVKAIDSLAPIEDPLIKAVGRKGELPLRNQLDRTLRADTIAGQFARDNGIHDVIQSAPNTKALDQYLIAKHARTLEANGIKTGRKAVNDTKLMDSLAPKYEQHAQAVTDYNHKLLDKTVEYGLISKDTAKVLKTKYPDYVPFDRIFKEGELNPAKGNGSGPASLSTQSVIQRIKGSDRQISSPLENILAKTHDVIAQGERNQSAKILSSYKDLPGNPLGLRELKPNEAIGARPTISFLENGQKHTFETTPEIAAAAKSLTKEQMNILGKILSYPTRLLRLGATGLNVGFAGANVVKDVMSAFINTEHPFRASIGNPKVFLDALSAATHHSGKAYSELVREGAGGTSFDIARNAAKDTVKRVRAGKNPSTKALYTVTHPGELLRAAENTIGRSEEFNRAIQYFGNKQAALKKGLPQREAIAYGADAARNNTVNFARAGEYGRVLNSVLPYFNAGLQGSRLLLRNLKERPLQTGTKIAVGAFMPSAVTTAWNVSSADRKAAYDDISDYEKQNNIIIVPPHPHKDENGRWNVIKIPVSQEVANANNVIRNGVEAMTGDKSFNLAQLFGNVAGSATSLNLQNPRQLVGQVTPQAVKPALEALTNQNLFTGNKIVPDSRKNLQPQDQYGDFTSGTAKVLGRLTHTSPYIIDNTIRTATGGLGQNIVHLSDSLLAKTGAINPDEVKGKQLIPSITDRFSGAQGKSVYQVAADKQEALNKQLQSLPDYKSMSPDDKNKALNRLKGDVSKTFLPPKDGKQVKLTPRQQALAGGKPDLASYLTAQKPGNTAKAIDINSKPDAQYNDTLKTYNQKKKDGTLNPAQDVKYQAILKRLDAGKNFDKNIRDAYTLSAANREQFVNNSANPDKARAELLAYDKALVDSGVIKKSKFASGSVTTRATAARTGGRRTTGSTRKTSTAKTSKARKASSGSSSRYSKYALNPLVTKQISQNKTLSRLVKAAVLKSNSTHKVKGAKKVALKKSNPKAIKPIRKKAYAV